jgi:hypothetical protein
MRQDTTLGNYGSVGNNTAINTNVVIINAPGPGRYRIWGTVRHTLADGFKMTSPVAFVFPSTPNTATDIGPFILDITNNTSGIILALNVATGASDTASAALFAEKINH